MGVLKVKDGSGNWVPIGVGVGLVDIERGTYTPTLTGITIGSGGLNEASYMFIGPTGVGAVGLMYVTGEIVCGTSGVSVGSGPTVTNPPGFSATSPGFTDMPCGNCTYLDASLSESYHGFLWRGSTTTFRFMTPTTAGLKQSPVTATGPFTWGFNDAFKYQAMILMARQ